VTRALAAAGVTDEDLVLVACSHGPDSLALADLLVDVHPRACLVYVDHGLRPESATEAERVRAFAAARGVRAEVLAVTVGEGLGPEDAARTARYAALDACADALGARWIALGHTASDQAETVLMRLLRGAGPTGLAGIPQQRGRYLRPLLDFSRDEILAHLANRELVPSHDASNHSPRFLRNRVRHQLMPLLRRENPKVDESLARVAQAMREVSVALDWAALQALPRVRRQAGRLDVEALRALPAAVGKRLISHLIPGLEARHLDAVMALVAADLSGSKAVDLPGRRVWREYGFLNISAENGTEWSIDIQGDGGPYAARVWQPGDRMRPARLKGRSRKLQDLFTDARVPRQLRAGAIVVVRESDQSIVWAEHLGHAVGVRLQVALTRP
jgi:tRNA(Ile)-lysidine synthase